MEGVSVAQLSPASVLPVAPPELAPPELALEPPLEVPAPPEPPLVDPPDPASVFWLFVDFDVLSELQAEATKIESATGK